MVTLAALSLLSARMLVPPLIPAANVTFLQSWQAESFTDSQWQQEFTYYVNAHIGSIVIGTTLDENTTAPPGTEPTYSPTSMLSAYPSSISGVTYCGNTPGTSISPVEECLKYASAHGMTVYLGLNFYAAGWFWEPPYPGVPFVTDSNWCSIEANRGNAVANELYTLYKSKYSSTFVGWYWPWEVDNLNFNNSWAYNDLISWLTTNFNYLRTQNSSMVRVLSPFYNPYLGGSYTPAAYQSLWTNVFAAAPFQNGDIFAPQDGIGDYYGENLTPTQMQTQINSWYGALKSAVNTKSGLTMWSNTETYRQQIFPNNPLVSAPMNRIANQFQDEFGYTSRMMAPFSYYEDPLWTNPAFNQAFNTYVASGMISSTAPSAPSGVVATGESNGTVELTWVTNPSVNGDSGFDIYRDGTLYSEFVIPNTARQPNTQMLWTDSDTHSNGAHHVYTLYAYDACGNYSTGTRVQGP